MTTMDATRAESFILLNVGAARFAVSSDQVAELVAADRQHVFPHRTQWIDGVLLCRGRIVPVCKIECVLPGVTGSNWRYYLLGRWRHGAAEDWVALPADGNSELFEAVPIPLQERRAGCITGLLWRGEETVEILDLQTMMDMAAAQASGSPANSGGGSLP
jgi:chemotaxis signal transduction protein